MLKVGEEGRVVAERRGISVCTVQSQTGIASQSYKRTLLRCSRIRMCASTKRKEQDDSLHSDVVWMKRIISHGTKISI